jgi:ribosome-associated protein
MIYIASHIHLQDHEVEYNATLAQGPGGQNVNTVNTAIQLRFDINNSSLPRAVKQRLLRMPDSRISKDGVLVIKAKEERSQLRNKEDALERLRTMIKQAMVVPKKRIPTKPKRSSVKKRLDSKTKRGLVKNFRKSVSEE